MKPHKPKSVPDPIVYNDESEIIKLTESVDENPVLDLQQAAWKKAGIIKSYRTLEGSVLAKIFVSKELCALAQGFDNPEALNDIIKIRDGIYLALATNEAVKWFGGKQLENIKEEDVEVYYEGIQNSEEFAELSNEIEQIYELKGFEKLIQKEGGAIIDCKKIQNGYIAKVIVSKEKENIDSDEVLFLVLKNGDHQILRMGGGQSHRITGEEVEIFFREIITNDHFKMVSDMFEIVRGSPKLLPAKGETSKASNQYT